MNSLIQGREQCCVEFAAELAPDVEKQLAAYARAVQELFGSEQVPQSVEDWMAEFELMNWPPGTAIPHWRLVTIAAASRLAFRVQHSLFKNPSEVTTLVLMRAEVANKYCSTSQ
jgi:hypothetical protein